MIKKLIIICFIIIVALSTAGCNQISYTVTDTSSNRQKENNTEKDDVEIKETKKDIDGNTEMSASDLLDAFVAGKIDAIGEYEGKGFFSVSDLENNDEEWLQFTEHSRFDVDNDGEEELIMAGPYGGMALDARNNKVFLLAKGEGTAGFLTFAKYDDAVWIVHADTSHGGNDTYALDKYNGHGEVVDSITLDENEIQKANLFVWDNIEHNNEVAKDDLQLGEYVNNDENYEYEGDELEDDDYGGGNSIERNPNLRTEFLDRYKVVGYIPTEFVDGVPFLIQEWLDKAFNNSDKHYNIQLDDQSLEKNEIYAAFDFTVDEYPGYSFRYAHYFGLDKVYISSPQLDRVRFDD